MPLHCITLDCWLEPEVEVAIEEAAGGSFGAAVVA